MHGHAHNFQTPFIHCEIIRKHVGNEKTCDFGITKAWNGVVFMSQLYGTCHHALFATGAQHKDILCPVGTSPELTEITQSVTLTCRFDSAVFLSWVRSMVTTCSGENDCCSPRY